MSFLGKLLFNEPRTESVKSVEAYIKIKKRGRVNKCQADKQNSF